jgi:hypothetical protein
MQAVRAHGGRVGVVGLVVLAALGCGTPQDPVTRSHPSEPTPQAVGRPSAAELPDFRPEAVEGFAP